MTKSKKSIKSTKSSCLKKHNYYTRSKPLKEFKFKFNNNTKQEDGGLKLKSKKNPENNERNQNFKRDVTDVQTAHKLFVNTGNTEHLANADVPVKPGNTIKVNFENLAANDEKWGNHQISDATIYSPNESFDSFDIFNDKKKGGMQKSRKLRKSRKSRRQKTYRKHT